MRYNVKSLLLLFPFFFVPISLRAQNDIYRAADERALAAPASVTGSTATLARWLAGSLQSDREKARAIFRWITANISYDAEAFFSGRPTVGSARDALRSRRGVCEGYSSLFTELSRSAGLTVEEIPGNAKGYGYAAGNGSGVPENHSWNAIRLDGRWQLIDCTWGAGYIGDDRRFHRQFNPHYFLTPPGEFIYDHYPDDAAWQLIDPPRSREEYKNTVYLKPAFFALGFSVGENGAGTIHTGGALTLRIDVSGNVAGAATVLDGSSPLDERCTFVQQEGNSLVVRGAIPAGDHTLRLFAKPALTPGEYAWILDYRVVSDGGSNDSFPKKFSAFDDRGARLIEPVAGVLAAGPRRFHIGAPGALQAAVVAGEEWTVLQGTGGDFSGEAAVRPGSVTVCARYPGHDEWEIILEFKGR
ncbi:MAG TPA: transglutaminase domain-containing protein [Bacteroidota bacterium]|nr:transglutaminase domain-containing protein [Bacteroidota bacterium]